MWVESLQPCAREPEILPLPVLLHRVSAGFPSPADDYLEGSLDLNRLMVQHPDSTFFIRVQGESMEGAGIQTGDILVVDRLLEARSGDVVLVIVDGEFMVKRWIQDADGACLKAEHPDYPDLVIHPELEFEIWGVVTYAVHSL